MVNTIISLLFLTLRLLPLSPADTTAPFQAKWEFNDLTGWTDASQNMDGTVNYALRQDTLRIFTRRGTWDRPKIKTVTSYYTAGTYTWRIYTPAVGQGDMTSFGAFLYQDDTHELDFEAGYGSRAVRQQLAAQEDDIVVYMTSQAHPFQSIPQKIKRDQWHDFSIRLDDQDGKYLATWFIDGNQATNLALGFGPETQFAIFCSVENLKFIGDHISKRDNYALFDYVEYKSN